MEEQTAISINRIEAHLRDIKKQMPDRQQFGELLEILEKIERRLSNTAGEHQIQRLERSDPPRFGEELNRYKNFKLGGG